MEQLVMNGKEKLIFQGEGQLVIYQVGVFKQVMDMWKDSMSKAVQLVLRKSGRYGLQVSETKHYELNKKLKVFKRGIGITKTHETRRDRWGGNVNHKSLF